jgi:hypothetical protein
MDPKLSEYFPAPNELTVDQVLAMRKMQELSVLQMIPDLDTRPNSAFGDLMLTPDALVLASGDEAVRKLLSDLDLSRVASGIIFNETFVRAYLANFGVDSGDSVNSTGVLKFTFSANKSFVIDGGSIFTFGDAEYRVAPEEGNPVVIGAAGSGNASRVLVKTGPATFVVHLPVIGTPGASVSDGAIATHNLTHEELVSVTAAGDFDPGQVEESLAQLAQRARETFASATLNSRATTHSFVRKNWPRIIGVSATLSTDREMIRGGENILGISTGNLDIYVRSQTRFVFGESTLELTYDSERMAWVGGLNFPTRPAFFALKAGVFQVGNFLNERGVNKVYSRSNDPLLDNLGVAYSDKEDLGIQVQDTNPEQFDPAANSDVKALVSDGTTLSVTGEYSGGLFNLNTKRAIRIRFDAVTTVDGLPAISAVALDSLSGETREVFFVGNSSVAPTGGRILNTTQSYRDMFNGLDLSVTPQSGQFVPNDLIGYTFEFTTKGKTANFIVSYLFDPIIESVDSVVKSVDNRPIGASILVKNFIICHISGFTVNYRFPLGSKVDLSSARREIFQYVNSLVFPNRYEESEVSRIMIKNGASGMSGVTKRGIFYPSLGNTFVAQDGTESLVPRFLTDTLTPPVNDYGFGERNMAFILDAETIQFNGTSV